MASTFDQGDAPESALEAAGLRFGDKGTHTSRTMMLAELTDLLSAVPPTASRSQYAEAIVEDNILGKPTASTRRLTNQRLGELYALSDKTPVFFVLRRLFQGSALGLQDVTNYLRCTSPRDHC